MLRKFKYFIQYKFSEFITILSACQPAVRLGSASAMAPVFHTTKVIAIKCTYKHAFATLLECLHVY